MGYMWFKMTNLVLRSFLKLQYQCNYNNTDIALWTRLKFQNLVRVVPSYLERLHDLIMVWLTVILILVVFIRIKAVIRLKGTLYPDSQILEVTWTIIPILILLTIASPRIYLLCLQDRRSQRPFTTIKVVSNQWNWQRDVNEEVTDHLLDIEVVDILASYESPIITLVGLDNRVLTIRTDVLHSLGLPSVGIKLDASPGRISRTVFNRDMPGVAVGSCYELCGSGHRAIPINVLTVNTRL